MIAKGCSRHESNLSNQLGDDMQQFYRRLYVYHHQRITGELHQIRTDAELADLSDQIWGNPQPHEWQLAIIACKPLPCPFHISR